MEVSLWGIMYFLFNMSLNELNFPLRLRNVISENAERREFSTFVHQSSSPWTSGVSGVKQIPLRAHAVSEGQRGAGKTAWVSFLWWNGSSVMRWNSVLVVWCHLGKSYSSSTGQHYGNLLSGVLLKAKETIVLCDVPMETVVPTPLGVLGVVKIFR